MERVLVMCQAVSVPDVESMSGIVYHRAYPFEAHLRHTNDREVQVILAEAERDGQTLRGEGDARSTEIYANAYGQDPEFYAFYRSLQAYGNAFGGSSDVMLLDPSSEFFQYFSSDVPK